MAELKGVLESCLYVDDLPRSRAFYQRVLQLEPMEGDDRFCALKVAGRDVLLLFRRGASTKPMPTPGGVIPPHDGTGSLHLAFAVEAAALPAWEARLTESGIAIESRVHWSRGGTSIYFRDPDNHLVELATPGVWAIY